MSRTVCLIPARKGSKRLPRKNVADFHGRPLAAWTLDFAVNCALFDEILLSTDEAEIQGLAPQGVKVIDRPVKLAGDEATLLDVIQQVIVDSRIPAEDTVVLTLVTAPLRIRDDLVNALEVFHKHERNHTVFTTCVNPHPPHLVWTQGEDGVLAGVLDRSVLGTRKQAFPKTYFWNDGFLIDTAARLLDKNRDLYGKDPVGVEAPPERSVAIDHAFDFWLAEQLFTPAQESN